MQPEPLLIEDLVRRIREVTTPERIIHFGSAARGEMTEDSDLDVLVVVAPGVHRRRTVQDIYQNLIGFGLPADIVVATTEDLERYGNSPSLVYYPALREGRAVYVA